jgi:hypothetical protein
MSNPTIKIYGLNGELIEEREMTDIETAERQAQIDALWNGGQS